MTNTKTTRFTLRRILNATVALGFAAAFAAAPLPTLSGLGGSAQAQGQGQGKGGGGQGGSGTVRVPGSKGAGGGSMGSSKGGTGDSTGEEGETDSDKKGPKYGGGANAQKPEQGTRGGKPVWAQEGIPEVELGRLSVARAPSHVITKALAEAVSNWATTGTTVLTLTAEGQPTLTMTVAQLYSLPAEQFANVVMTYYPSIVRIDSPLENLGLLQDLGTTGTTQLTGVTPASLLDLEAIFLGSASDKTLSISVDTVIAMSTLLALPSMTIDQVTALAAKAEAVRLAILIGHDG